MLPAFHTAKFHATNGVENFSYMHTSARMHTRTYTHMGVGASKGMGKLAATFGNMGVESLGRLTLGKRYAYSVGHNALQGE